MVALEGLYNQVMDKPLQILEVFNEFFGEERVDLEGFPSLESIKQSHNISSLSKLEEFFRGATGYILVKFPYVKITNEFGRSTDIYDLFAKINIKLDGTMLGGFTLNRATYSLLHISNGYMHSHVSNIPFDDFSRFQRPCTGTGPINSTMYTLSEGFDKDIWRLFCLELDKYVHVESVAGVPYHRLEGLASNSRSRSIYYESIHSRAAFPNYSLSKVNIAEFTKYLIDNDIFKFSYNDGGFNLAMSGTEAIIRISNAFIKWFNRQHRYGKITLVRNDLLNDGTLKKAVFKNGRILIEIGQTRRDYSQYIGRTVCVFKGQPVTISIPDLNDSSQEENIIYILNSDIISYIITSILKVLNFRYGNTEQEDPSSAGKTVLYL